MNLLHKPSLNFSAFAKAAVLVMAIVHVIGIAGLNNHTYRQLFESIASINLLVSFLLVIVFHSPANRTLLSFCIFAFSVGMVIEITGVNTGYPFGIYHYTPTFGWQLYGVPVIIGINWILLSYVTGMVANMLLQGEWQKIVAASVLMMAIDFLLESFAIRHHFWVWQDRMPPVQNYIAWFIISIVIQSAFRKLLPTSINANAAAYLVILLLFLFTDLLFAIHA